MGLEGLALEDSFHTVAAYVALAAELGAVLVVALGSVQAMFGVVGAIFTGTANEVRGRRIWLKFATWILLALEFALAADILHTAVAPTWEDIWKLAVIAVVRTMLNYFLARDIADFSKLEVSPQNQPGGPASP